MLLTNYSFQKYQDRYYIYNTDPGTITYTLSQQQNCADYIVISTGSALTNTTGLGTEVIIPVDGDYTLDLVRGNQTDTINFRHYLLLQKNLLYNLKLAICGQDCRCKDCNEQGLDDCFFYKPLFNQLLGYQFLIKPYEGDYCQSNCLFDNYLDQALNLNRCQIYGDLYNQLCFQSMGVMNQSSRDALMYIACIYYLAFYFFESLKSADLVEQAYIDSKFYYPEISLCIKKFGININDIKAIYQATSYTCNTAPTVNNVQLYLSDVTPGDNVQTYVFKTSDFTTGFSDNEGDSPADVKILSNVFNGQLTYNGYNIDGEDFIFDISNVGLLRYIYSIDETTDLFDKIFFQISDDNATPKYSNMATISISANAYINQPPNHVGDNSFTVANRSTKIFTLADFTTTTTPAYSDPEGDPVDALRVNTLPVSGQLLLGTTPVTINQIIPVSSINAGMFKYVSPDQNPEADVSFTYSLRDTGSLTFSS